MNTKLTLSLDETVIEKAKAYASERKISLSKMIESYLSTVVHNNFERAALHQEITPLVTSLSGVITLDEDFDVKEVYGKHLVEKYS